MSGKGPYKAFTLIEMLVSLALVGTIMTMVYGSYAATSRSLDVYSSRMACSERAHLALRLMARQIRCAYMPPAATRPAQADAGTPAAPIVAFQAERTDMLSFLTTGGPGSGLDKPLGISRVAYRYDRPSATLLFCCEPGASGSGGARGSGAWRPVLRGIADMELAFHDGRQWQSRWDSKQAGRLPQAVKIALAVADEQGRAHRYATTIPVICQTRTQGKP